MNPNQQGWLKFLAAVLGVLALIGLQVGKHFWQDFDITLLDTVIISMLTTLGVLHVAGSDTPSKPVSIDLKETQ